jgi:hypothetical protein
MLELSRVAPDRALHEAGLAVVAHATTVARLATQQEMDFRVKPAVLHPAGVMAGPRSASARGHGRYPHRRCASARRHAGRTSSATAGCLTARGPSESPPTLDELIELVVAPLYFYALFTRPTGSPDPRPLVDRLLTFHGSGTDEPGTR